MKKLILAFTFITVVSTALQAQNFKGELFIGINGTQIDGDLLSGYNKPGLMLGAGTFFEIGDDFLFHISGLYNQKGAQTKMDKNNNQFKQRLNYIDFPVFLEYKVWRKLYLGSGLTPGYLISAKSFVDGYETDNRDQFRTIGLDWLFGVKYDVADNLGLGVRFSYSVISTLNNLDYYNNVLSFYSSFYF